VNDVKWGKGEDLAVSNEGFILNCTPKGGKIKLFGVDVNEYINLDQTGERGSNSSSGDMNNNRPEEEEEENKEERSNSNQQQKQQQQDHPPPSSSSSQKKEISPNRQKYNPQSSVTRDIKSSNHQDMSTSMGESFIQYSSRESPTKNTPPTSVLSPREISQNLPTSSSDFGGQPKVDENGTDHTRDSKKRKSGSHRPPRHSVENNRSSLGSLIGDRDGTTDPNTRGENNRNINAMLFNNNNSNSDDQQDSRNSRGQINFSSVPNQGVSEEEDDYQRREMQRNQQQRQKLVPQQSTQSNLRDILSQQSSVQTSLANRLTHLRMIRSSWERGNIEGVISYIGTLHESSSLDGQLSLVLADFFSYSSMGHTSGVFTLNHAASFLPILSSIITSTITPSESSSSSSSSNLAALTLSQVNRLVEGFGEVIRSTRSSGSLGSVDISREERLERCNSCYTTLTELKRSLRSVKREFREDEGVMRECNRFEDKMRDKFG